ncbi:MAG: hypothetical protein ACOCV8_05490 [Spirochaetota bacterium]
MEIIAVVCSVVNFILLIFLLIRFRWNKYEESVIKRLKKEVSMLIKELNRVTDRNITLIESSINEKERVQSQQRKDKYIRKENLNTNKSKKSPAKNENTILTSKTNRTNNRANRYSEPVKDNYKNDEEKIRLNDIAERINKNIEQVKQNKPTFDNDRNIINNNSIKKEVNKEVNKEVDKKEDKENNEYYSQIFSSFYQKNSHNIYSKNNKKK